MTVPQARRLQTEYYQQHPIMRLMDLIYRVVSKGNKPLWASAEKPRQVSEEKTQPVSPLLSDTLMRLGWTPPPK